MGLKMRVSSRSLVLNSKTLLIKLEDQISKNTWLYAEFSGAFLNDIEIHLRAYFKCGSIG
jgi:hypothetical protein